MLSLVQCRVGLRFLDYGSSACRLSGLVCRGSIAGNHCGSVPQVAPAVWSRFLGLSQTLIWVFWWLNFGVFNAVKWWFGFIEIMILWKCFGNDFDKNVDMFSKVFYCSFAVGRNLGVVLLGLGNVMTFLVCRAHHLGWGLWVKVMSVPRGIVVANPRSMIPLCSWFRYTDCYGYQDLRVC